MAKEYLQFIKQIKYKLGIDLNLYKEAQMKRRLTSLRNKRGFNSFSDYYHALEKDEILMKEFIDRLTINVSEFYRNPKRWDVLKNKVFPYLIQEQSKISIWSAACSTGEEPYSVAIMLKEYFPEIEYHILATDIDHEVLIKAEKGIYQEQSLKELPMMLKNKYFMKKNGLYMIDPSLKEFISFKHHNLLADQYPKDIDLIICRNVLIYFTDEAKSLIYRNFSESLSERGILFVGSTEQIFTPHDYDLAVFDTFFYKKMSYQQHTQQTRV